MNPDGERPFNPERPSIIDLYEMAKTVEQPALKLLAEIKAMGPGALDEQAYEALKPRVEQAKAQLAEAQQIRDRARAELDVFLHRQTGQESPEAGI